MQRYSETLPLYERISDYLFNMSALTTREAKAQWRKSIKDAWDNRCAYCGRTPIVDASLTDLTIDHVRPKSKGGEDRTCNVIPACKRCNGQKGSDEWMAWYRMQPFYSIEGEWRIRQWLSGQNHHFSLYDEEDAKAVDNYATELLGEWPTTEVE